MQIIPIDAIPNQNFTTTLENYAYDFRINTCVNITTITLSIDQEVILDGERIPPFSPVIPYRYLEKGNFAFLTQNEEYPIYSQFGVSQFLVYLTQEEIATLRNAANR